MSIKTESEIERVLRSLPADGTRFSGMTYEQGIEDALRWVRGEIEEDDLEYFGDRP